ncbi:MAG: hypothetical protein ACT4PM_10360 [Gemmatimonadales bacterium]
MIPDDVVLWIQQGDEASLRIGWRTWTPAPIAARRLLRELTGYESKTPEAQRIAMRRLFRLAFPRRISHWWRGDPLQFIQDLPSAQYQRVVRDFLRWAVGDQPRLQRRLSRLRPPG